MNEEKFQLCMICVLTASCALSRMVNEKLFLEDSETPLAKLEVVELCHLFFNQLPSRLVA